MSSSTHSSNDDLSLDQSCDGPSNRREQSEDNSEAGENCLDSLITSDGEEDRTVPRNRRNRNRGVPIDDNRFLVFWSYLTTILSTLLAYSMLLATINYAKFVRIYIDQSNNIYLIALLVILVQTLYKAIKSYQITRPWIYYLVGVLFNLLDGFVIGLAVMHSSQTSVIRIAVLSVVAACSLFAYRLTPIQRLVSDYVNGMFFAIFMVAFALLILQIIFTWSYGVTNGFWTIISLLYIFMDIATAINRTERTLLQYSRQRSSEFQVLCNRLSPLSLHSLQLLSGDKVIIGLYILKCLRLALLFIIRVLYLQFNNNI